MLGATYLDFIRYFYYTCLTRHSDVLAQFRNLAGATQRIKIDKIESQVAPAEEAGDNVQISEVERGCVQLMASCGGAFKCLTMHDLTMHEDIFIALV